MPFLLIRPVMDLEQLKLVFLKMLFLLQEHKFLGVQSMELTLLIQLYKMNN